MNKKIISLFVVLISSFTLSVMSKTTDDRFEEMKSLDWLMDGKYQLPLSHSSLSIPVEYMLVIGNDARKLSSLIGNSADSSLEAIALASSDDCIYFENVNDGYISLSDWEKVNPTQLLLEIKEGTEDANKERRKNGFPDLHVLRWIQEPTLDRHTNTVYWAIEHAEDGSDENSFNSTALRLGRSGFEKVIWVGEISKYKAFGGELDIMLRAHSFDPGYRYKDHTTGDKVASYGVASLVAATVGAKIAKVGGIVILFKKIGGFLLAGLAIFFRKLKKLIFGDKNTNQ